MYYIHVAYFSKKKTSEEIKQSTPPLTLSGRKCTRFILNYKILAENILKVEISDERTVRIRREV
jgi:hypothetical protein